MSKQILATLLCALLPTACSTTPTPAKEAEGERQVELRNGTNPSGPARYDSDTGQCSGGFEPLISREEFDALRAGWRTPKGARTCTGPGKASTPRTTGYPERFAALERAGSAHVVVRIEADGSVESARAACATDSAFARAAEATAAAIRFSPRVCDGVPVRNIFLLPFDYDWK